MKTNKLFKSTTFLIISAVALVTSCKDEERITRADTQDITEEAVTDSYFQDMDDMGGVAIQTPTEDQLGSGRVKAIVTVNDARFRCSGTPVSVTVEPAAGSTKANPMGVITVNFGSGCTDLQGNTRSGKLIFTYSGRRFMPGSTVVTTGDNYIINGIKLEGTRTLTNVTTSTADTPSFNIKLAGGKATFDDLTFATRDSDITSKWIRASSPLEDKLIIEQGSTANGTTRGGRTYKVDILAQLEFKRACGIAVTGIKKYTIDGDKEITIDYGDGTCDKDFTMTVSGGVTRSISVK